MILSLSTHKKNLIAIMGLGFILAVLSGWAIGSARTELLLFLTAGVAITVLLLRFPELPLAIAYPSLWIFGHYNIPILGGRIERALVIVGVVGLAFLLLRDRKALVGMPRIVVIGMYLLILPYFLSWLFSTQVYRGEEYVISMLARLIFFYVTFLSLRTRQHLRWAMGLFIAAGFFAGIVVLFASLTFGFGFMRVYEGSQVAYANLGPLWSSVLVSGNFITASGILLISFFQEMRERYKQWLLLGVIIFLFWMAFASQYRREILITIPLILLVLALNQSSGLRKPALAIIILWVVFFLIVVLPSPVLQMRLENESQIILVGADTRTQSAQAGLQAFFDSPWIGSGPGTYEATMLPILGPNLLSVHYHAYNVFIWISVELGAMGLLGMVLIILGTFLEAHNNIAMSDSIEIRVLRSSPTFMLLITVWYTFGNSWDNSVPWFLMALVLAASRLSKAPSIVQQV